MQAKLPANEDQRIQALHSLEILDTPPEEKFDRITRIAQIIFEVPIALVSLVDENRQWFKSCAGLSVRETPRSMSFCAHAILNDNVLVIEDATKDSRFSDNPLVTGEPYIKFYAGKPIMGPDNQMLGTICIINRQPQKLSKADKTLLTDLGKWVETEFKTISLTRQLKENGIKLQNAERNLREQNENLEEQIKEKTTQLIKNERFSAIGELSSRLAHDIRNPISVIKTAVILMKQTHRDLDEKELKTLEMVDKAASKIKYLVENVLDFVRSQEPKYAEVSLLEILQNARNSIPDSKNIKFFFPKNDIKINCDPNQIEVVFENLMTNSVQAIGVASGSVTVRFHEEDGEILISIQDSGEGIPEDKISRIFDPLFTTKEEGTGLGLASCKSIIESHKGTITVSTNPTTFKINLPKNLNG